MTGRHAAFLITRAAKKYLMRKRDKDGDLTEKLHLVENTDASGETPEMSTVHNHL